MLVIAFSAATAAVLLCQYAVPAPTIGTKGLLLVGESVSVGSGVNARSEEPRAQHHVAPFKLISRRQSEPAPTSKYVSLDLEDFQ
ncbi:MAG TPA: hypothetical protein VGR03_05570 [Candidatus Acidoferrum sp.]|nr:hypothetical protein [Candidatus Acidoferrum sp.]